MKKYDLSGFRTLFLAGERLDPDTLRLGRSKPRACRSSTTGGRPRPAGRSPPTAWGCTTSRSRRARPPSRARAGTCRSWTPTSKPVEARRHRCAGGQAAAAARHPADPVEQRRGVPEVLPGGIPGLLQDRRRRLHRRGRLRLRHGAAPTTSSTWPATASPPAPWRRCCPTTRTWPSARSSAWTTTSRARCPSASSC